MNIMKYEVREESVEFDFDIGLTGSSLFQKMPRFIRFVFLKIS